MRLLIVEDERKLARLLQGLLQDENHAVDLAFDGEEAMEFVRSGDYDLIILDVMLPRMDGLEVCREIRAKRIQTPILMLTARTSVEDRVAGLDAGADDYLSKPFDLDELAARVRALLRRSGGRTNPLLTHGDIHFDPASNLVTYKGKNISLSSRELMVLAALIEKPGAVLSRAQLVDKVYGWNDEVESNTIEVHVHALRKKLSPGVIRNIRGLGYMLSNNESPCVD